MHTVNGSVCGIGGFANITAKTPTVVFCFSFTAKGLGSFTEGGLLRIEKEGSISKFVDPSQE